ncbi:hypothetical protein CYMTET_40107 [Cymbomonas tetramitiformis]|uniref:Transmembrane protein n=1 Tax=Cymbomonas tetramitiformis TaxID=36881 RepID=A0AAE0CAU2_9CHLO|nr:hypothetical protein CYMTET_40107 [Cymbomonas tetramitiformis]|eukprot:gene9968-11802_t
MAALGAIDLGVSAFSKLGAKSAEVLGVAAATAAGRQTVNKLSNRTLAIILWWSFMLIAMYAAVFMAFKYTSCEKVFTYSCFGTVGGMLVLWLVCATLVHVRIITRLPDIDSENAKSLQVCVRQKFDEVSSRLDATVTLLLNEIRLQHQKAGSSSTPNAISNSSTAEGNFHPSAVTSVSGSGLRATESGVREALNTIQEQQLDEPQLGVLQTLSEYLEQCASTAKVTPEDVISRLKDSITFDALHPNKAKRLKEVNWFDVLQYALQRVSEAQVVTLIKTAQSELSASNQEASLAVLKKVACSNSAEKLLHSSGGKVEKFKQMSKAFGFLRLLYFNNKDGLKAGFEAAQRVPASAWNPTTAPAQASTQRPVPDARAQAEINPFLQV